MQKDKVKILIVGMSATGKSSIITSYLQNRFSQQMAATFTINNSVANLKINNKLISLQIWDTAGQQKFAIITKQFYHNTDAFLIVFDIVHRSSLTYARQKLYPSIRQLCPDSTIFFVGNKIDLRQEYRQKYGTNQQKSPVEYEDAKKILKEQYHCQYYECSAKAQQGIHEVFEHAAKAVLKKRQLNALKNHQIQPYIKPESKQIKNSIGRKQQNIAEQKVCYCSII